jgi:FKBP-type peptidyl-prolyl cis-trans isomerase FklB
MRKPIGLITCLLSIFALGSAVAGTATALDSDNARQSYSAGYQAVSKLQGQGKEADLAALLRGALDALAGTPQLDTKEMQALLKGLDQTQPAHGVRDELSPIREGQAFLAANAARPDIKTLPSGLQYRVIQMGTGIKPRLTDSVVVHYRGSKVDGQEVDSSYDENRPEVYRVDEVMPGWTEALQLMPEGSEWELYIPSSLAYGKRGPLENQALIYHIKLLSVIADKAAPDAQPAAIQE